MEKFKEAKIIMEDFLGLYRTLTSKTDYDDVKLKMWIINNGATIIDSWYQLYQIAERAEDISKTLDKMKKLERFIIDLDNNMRSLRKLSKKIKHDNPATMTKL